MALSYTTRLRLAKMDLGDQTNTWGTVQSEQDFDMADEAWGVTDKSCTAGGTITLSTANGTTDESRGVVLNLSGSPAGAFTIVIPNLDRPYIIRNASGQTATIQTATPTLAQTLVTGKMDVMFCDGAASVHKLVGNIIGTDVQAYNATLQDIATYNSVAPRGHIAGLGISNHATVYQLDVAEGECRSTANDETLTLAAFSKVCTATWTSGTGNNGLATGATAKAGGVWYHVFVVSISGTIDVMFDSSLTCSNGASSHGVTSYRRIGSVQVNVGNTDLIDFVQTGEHFLWVDPPLDINVTDQSTTAVSRTLSVPPDIKMMARISITMSSGAAGAPILYVRSLDANDEAPSGTVAPMSTIELQAVGASSSLTFSILTNTSKQITTRSDQASTEIQIVALGWDETRGRND